MPLPERKCHAQVNKSGATLGPPTLRSRKISLCCILERTGNPFLLVRKMLVGRIAALMGSPSQRSMT